MTNQTWLDILPVATIVASADARIVLASEKAARMFGYAGEELLQRTVPELIPELFAGAEADAWATTPVKSVIVHRKDGAEIETEIAVNHIGEGENMRACIVIRDVTEQKRAEAMARDREARLDLIFNNVTDFLVLLRVEPNGGFTTESMNRAAIAYVTRLGSDGASFVGKDFALLLAATGLSEAEIEERRRAYQNAVEARAEAHYVRQHDPWRDATEVRIYPVLGRDGRCTHILSSARIITDRMRAEAALREREERLRLVFNAHQDLQAIIRIEADGGFINEAFNQAQIDYLRQFIPDPNAFLERPREDVMRALGATEEEIERSFAMWREVAATKSARKFEVFYTQPRPEAVEAMISPILNQAGECTRLLWTAHVVTERRRAEEELRKRERDLAEAQSIGHIGSWSWEIADNRLVWSDEVYRILGFEPQEMPPEALPEFLDHVHPDDRERVEREVWLAFRERRPHDIEHRIVRRDGSVRLVHTKSVVQMDSEGKPIGVRATLHDVTEERQVAEHLRENQRILEEAQHMARVGSFYSPDAESGKVEWSAEWYRIFELDPSVGAPRIEQVLSRTHPEDREAILEEYEKVSTTECDSAAEQRLIMPDGRIKYVLVQGSTRRGPDGKLQMRGTVQDITERKIAEEERADLQERLAQAQKMESIGRLAGGVAHDFNNMLTVILGYTAMSKGPVAGDPRLSHNLTEIAKAANRAKEITEKLLGFSRQQIISPEPSNINDLIADLRDPLSRLIGEDVELVFHPGAEIWTVVVDHSQVNQILLNLVVNARDAMPNGGILTIETENVELSEEYCRRQPGTRPGPYVQLSVSDTGTGMDEQTASHIFEPFFTTKRPDKGTGLGLATVYGIARQNDGFVTVYTELGHGTTFKIYLPKIAGPAVGVPELDTVPEKIAKGQGTILLTEDDELVREMTRSALELIGYDPLVAETPRQAIEICQQKGETIRLLLTDVVMPGMNGMELRERIREINPEIRVLFMSGYTSNVIVTHGVLKKGVHFIQKPFSMEDLARRIQEVLEEE